MSLFETIVDANHRALAGDAKAGVHPDDFRNALPVVALTCIDPRLNPLIPEALGVREEDFIWLRNAGNIITGPLSSTLRSLALACAIKGGKEIAIVGHTDCLVAKTTVMQLLDRFHALGVERARLPDNLQEFFGLFASERQNVIKASEIVRRSPLIGPKIPVHGLLMDITTGKLEWLVNGYQTFGTASEPARSDQRGTLGSAASTVIPGFSIEELKFPDFKIGERAASAQTGSASAAVGETHQTASPSPVEKAKSDAPIAQPTPQLDPTRRYRIIGSDQKTYGPIAAEKLLQWLAEGRVDWQDPAQAEGTTEWRPLSTWTVLSEKLHRHVPPKIQAAAAKVWEIREKLR